MHALKVLEYASVSEAWARHAETPLAAERIRDAKPAFSDAEVRQRLAETAEAIRLLETEFPPHFLSVRDLRTNLKRASKGGVLGGVELVQVMDALRSMEAWRAYVEPRSERFPLLGNLATGMPTGLTVLASLTKCLDPDGSVRDEASDALAQIRTRIRQSVQRIVERIQQYISGKTRELLSDPIYTVRDGRYVLPLKAENRGKIKGIVHDTSASGLTIYVEPDDVLQLGNALREAESAERIEEHRILQMLSEWVGSQAAEIATGVERVADTDEILARARYGFAVKGVLPTDRAGFPSEAAIRIVSGKHPLLDPDQVVPLDLEVHAGQNVLITGPNTGGKTVAMKCVGLFVAMLQSGLPVPAAEVNLSPFRQLWADIGDEQSLQQSLSTFSGHIKNIADALRWLKPGALVLLDEIGAGTDPAEGAALAVAVLRELRAKGAVILASTHYGELKAFAYNQPEFVNAAMEFDSRTFRPTYRLLLGAAGASQALRIAERYGIPPAVVDAARAELGTQAQDIARMLEQLENAQKQARAAQSEADRRTAEVRRQEQTAARKLAEADEIRKTVHGKANEFIEAALREIRLDAERLFDELKRTPHDPKTQQRVRQGLKELDAVGRDFAKEFVPKTPARRESPPERRVPLEKGQPVTVEGYSQAGIVLEAPQDQRVLVQLGMLKIRVPVDSVRLAKLPAQASRPKTNLRLQRAMSAQTELHLRQLRFEDAERELDRFMDDALLAGLPSVRIVHGKGEGVLRKLVHDYLRRHRSVKSYEHADPANGGDGVTVAQLG